MINDLLDLINSETIYLVANWGVIPFWLLLIIFPNHSITNFFVQSIIAPLLLATAYGYLSYNLYLDNDILSGFELYGGLDGLYSMFANEILLLIFWLHFLSISLFAGAWIVRDARKCSQNINSKVSLENIEYKPSSPLYNSNPPKILFSRYKL